MANALLINTADLTGFTDININTSGQTLRNAVIKAQDLVLQPVIGLRLFEKIADGIINDNLIAPYTTLNEVYIAPVLIQAARINVIDESYLSPKRNALGQAINTPGFTGATRVQYKELKDAAYGEMEHHLDRLREYLKAKQDMFPELIADVDIDSDEADLDTDTNYGSPLIINQDRLESKRRNKYRY